MIPIKFHAVVLLYADGFEHRTPKPKNRDVTNGLLPFPLA